MLLRSFSGLQGENSFIQIEIGKYTHISYDEISTNMIQREAYESDHSTAPSCMCCLDVGSIDSVLIDVGTHEKNTHKNSPQESKYLLAGSSADTFPPFARTGKAPLDV